MTALPLVGPTRQEALRRLAETSETGPALKPRGAQGEPAPQAVSDRLRALFQAEGETTIVKRLGIDRGTLVRVIAGLPVRRGTVALVEEALAQEPRP